MDSFRVVIYKCIFQNLCGFLVAGKLVRPDVLLFEGLVKRFHMAVLLWRVLPDELMFADSKCRYCLSKIMTSILNAVVCTYAQSWAVRFFCSNSICDGAYCNMPCRIGIKAICYPFACKTVNDIKGITVSVYSAINVCNVCLP